MPDPRSSALPASDALAADAAADLPADVSADAPPVGSAGAAADLPADSPLAAPPVGPSAGAAADLPAVSAGLPTDLPATDVSAGLPSELPAAAPPVAVVTGASSGIGAATARALAGDRFHVVCAARRADRIEALAAEIGGTAVVCDITDPASVAALASGLDDVAVLVNNAGGAFDAAPVAEADPEVWARMYDVNVLGTLRMTQSLLPALRAGAGGLVVNIGSTAGRAAYEGGGGYTAAKHALRVLRETLRLEHVAEPLRFTEIAPGMVHTEEFSLVRFAGDRSRAEAVYAGVAEPLTAEDIAEAVRWVASLPAHVNVDEIVVRPRAQAAQHKVHREG